MPRTAASVVIVDYPGAQQAAVHGLVDLLGTAGRLHEKRTGTRALEAVALDEARLGDARSRITAAVLPPALGDPLPPAASPALARWLLRAHSAGTTLCSVCVGAFVLAGVGVLDGRPATTHWALRDAFAAKFPAVRVDVDRLIIDDADVITAGGLMAWIDLGLHLVERYLGPTTLLETARYFLVDPRGREQRFYSTFAPVLAHGDDQILKVQRWLQRQFATDVDVTTMAKIAGLGERTFLRRFQSATGLKTRAYVQTLRVAKARELLELGTKSLQEIAWAVGYDDAGAFRAVFIERMGISPAEYRRRLGVRS